MGKILLRYIILNNQDSDILVSEGLIAKIAPAGALDCGMTDVEVMDCEGKTAVPGFVNMHTHAAMSLMRGVGEDIAFHEWIDNIWKIEQDLS